MSTTLLSLPTYTGPAMLPATAWNGLVYTVDNLNRAFAADGARGVVSGWGLTVAKSTVTSGGGIVGGAYAKTTGSQLISGLQNGRNYIYARADGGTPASMTVDFIARLTSTAVTNQDGVTYTARLGYLQRTAGAVSGVYPSGTANWPRDKVLSGVTETRALLDGVRYSGAVLQYRSRNLQLNHGIVIGTATTGAWTTAPTV